ncbi:MAG TPA: PRC-barrel domain-containing protein [Chloroflexota bacterium]|nr:PRC-barrel domain-containing protein [Chloroflexota bacterium]
MDTVINPGEDVIGPDGNKLGTVAFIVVNPETMKMTDLVVSTGTLLGRDIVVPESDVARTEDGRIQLSVDEDGLKALPDYVDVQFQSPPAGWIPTAGFSYPSGALLWPAGIYYPEETKVTVNTPQGTVGVTHGMDVVSSDGHKVGSIDAVVTDPTTNQVGEIVVKHGFIFTHDTAIPASHITAIEADRVKLDLDQNQVKALEKASES